MAIDIGAILRRLLLVQLVLAVFLVAPMAEAASCTAELSPAHATLVDDNGQGSKSMEKDHAICSHGHCHHTSVTRTTGQISEPVSFGKPPFDTGWHDDLLASVTPEGLMRPPRA